MKIYITYENEPHDTWEKYVIEKGWRDVIVENNSKFYLIEVISIDRLQGEYDYATQNGQAYFQDLPTLISDNVSTERVIELLQKIDPCYFDLLTPINCNSPSFINSHPQFAEIEELTCIYDSDNKQRSER